jgi:hypothetical protein
LVAQVAARVRLQRRVTASARRVTGWAVLAAVAVTVLPGCVTSVNAETPAQVRKQAGMVSLMISNAMGAGQLTEADLMWIVEGNGGGYVTAITRTGRAGTPSERTVVHAVLGTSIVSGNGSPDGLGKPVAETPAVLCYRFTVGYYSYQIWRAQEPCPRPGPGAAGGFAATATAQAGRVWSAQNALAKLPRQTLAQVRAAPASPSQARRQLGLGRRARRVAGILPLTASEFAADGGRAGLALRLRAGGCIYLSVPDDPAAEACPAPG